MLLDAKPIVIAVLRDPMTRALSSYTEVMRLSQTRAETIASPFYALRDDPQACFNALFDETRAVGMKTAYNQHLWQQLDVVDQTVGREHVTHWFLFEAIEDQMTAFIAKHYAPPTMPEFRHHNSARAEEMRVRKQIVVDRERIMKLYREDAERHTLLATTGFVHDEHFIWRAHERMTLGDLIQYRKWIDSYADMQKLGSSKYRFLDFVDDADVADHVFTKYLSGLPFLARKPSSRIAISRYEDTAPASGLHREHCSEEWQAIIYLTESFNGGELSFHDDDATHLLTHTPKSGDIVLFPTRLRHNAHALVAGGAEKKYIMVIRIDAADND